MTGRLPRITAAQAIPNQSGSHTIYKNGQGLRATVPTHAGKILHPKVLKSILPDANLAPDEFLEFL